MTGKNRDAVIRQTIKDFGAQWTRYPDNDGYYASATMLADILAPFATPEELRGAHVAEIGSGSGRIVNMLLDAGAAHVVALEPSAAMEALRRNIADRSDRVTCVQMPGEQLPLGNYDAILSIGVLHHIADPTAGSRAAFRTFCSRRWRMRWFHGCRFMYCCAGFCRCRCATTCAT